MCFSPNVIQNKSINAFFEVSNIKSAGWNFVPQTKLTTRKLEQSSKFRIKV